MIVTIGKSGPEQAYVVVRSGEDYDSDEFFDEEEQCVLSLQLIECGDEELLPKSTIGAFSAEEALALAAALVQSVRR